MSKLLILLALCVLPALVSASRPLRFPFIVHGRVYCDTCRCGFETEKTTYIEGAKVRIECKDRRTLGLLFTKETSTDKEGKYEVSVAFDHADQICEASLVSSPLSNCAAIKPGRERSTVILTNSNGMSSNERFANNLGFEKDEALPGCTELLHQLLEVDV